MAPRPIRLFGDPVLRRRAREADPAAPATRALLDRMWEVLREDGGVGLAGPQVGSDLRVVVVRDPSRPRDAQRLDLVNPVIRRTFGPETPFEEGCLSFPGLYTVVNRPRGVEVEYRTPDTGDAVQRLRDEAAAMGFTLALPAFDAVLAESGIGPNPGASKQAS